MLGQAEVMEFTFENDIGEHGEIYESAVFQCCYCDGHMPNGCRLTNTESKHVKTAYIPDWIMYVHMSGIEIEELWVQPSEPIQYKWHEAEHNFKRIDKLHVRSGSVYNRTICGRRNKVGEIIIHGDLGKYHDDTKFGFGVSSITFDKNYRYETGRFFVINKNLIDFVANRLNLGYAVRYEPIVFIINKDSTVVIEVMVFNADRSSKAIELNVNMSDISDDLIKDVFRDHYSTCIPNATVKFEYYGLEIEGETS